MATLELHNLEGKAVGTVNVPKDLEGTVKTPVLWQAVRMYLANQRQGTADTKTRGEVSGGGKKPWRQKHTGRARAGSIRSPLWRKGGVVFGPHPREYRYHLPEKIRRLALVESLKAKVAASEVVAVDSFEGIPSKTKSFAQALKRLQVTGRALVVIEQADSTLARISRNLPGVKVIPASDITCYDVLESAHLVVTSGGLKKLEARLS